MTITISKSLLLSKLQIVSKIISAKSSTPILSHFFFETKEGRLFVTGSNSEGRITTSIECIFDEEVSVCVPVSIVDGLKSLPEQPINVIINSANYEIRINYHGGKFEIAGYDSVTYPNKQKIESQDSITLTAEELYYGISKVINLAAEDSLRPIITSVFLEATPGSACFVGTDGHGMGFIKKKGNSRKATASLVISRSIASILKAIIPVSDEMLDLRIGSDWTEVLYADLDISFRNQEGRYPNWRSVIPGSNDKELIVDTRLLEGAIKRTSVFSNKVSCLIVFEVSMERLRVSARDIDFSTSAEENLPAEFKGKDISIGLKGSIMQEILSCIDNERVRLTFSDPSKAILITPEKQTENEELTYLLMPMTINN